jgi:hypothetical protein
VNQVALILSLHSLRKLDNQIKVKYCHHVEVCTFKVFFFNYFDKMRENCGDGDNEVLPFTRNSLRIFFILF